MTTPVGSIRLDLTIDGSNLDSEITTAVNRRMAPAMEALQRQLNDVEREYGQTARAGEKSGAKQTAAVRGVADAVDRLSDEYSKVAAKAQASERISTRSLNAQTRAIDKQTAAWARLGAAQTAAAAAPTPNGPQSGGGGGGASGGGRGGGGGRSGGRGGIGGFLTGPVGLNALALGASGLPAATTAVVNLVGAVQALGQVGFVVPGVIAGIASSVGTAKLGFVGMADAIKALTESDGSAKDLKKIEESLKGMDPAAVAVAKSVAKLTTGPLKDLQKLVAGNMFAGVDKTIDDLANRTIPTLEKGLGGIGTAWNNTFKELGRVGGLDSTQSFLDRIFGNTADAQNRANAAIDPLVHAFGSLAATGSDFLPRLADGLTALTTRFDAFITKADQSGQLAKWIDEGFKAAANLGESLLNVGKIITDLTGAAGGDGGFLKWLRDVTGQLHTFLSSDAGQKKLQDFFTEGKAKLDEWVSVLQSVARVALQVFDGFKQWGDVLLPVIKSISDALLSMGGDSGAIAGIVTAFLAWKTITGIGSLLGGLGKVDSMLGSIGGKASGLKGKLGGLGTLGPVAALGGFLAQPTDGTQPSNGLAALAAVGGGALTGFQIGGPWGAAIGAIVGGGTAIAQALINQANRIDNINKRAADDLAARPPATPAIVAPTPGIDQPNTGVAPPVSVEKPRATDVRGLLVPPGLSGAQLGPFGTGTPVAPPNLATNFAPGLAEVAQAAKDATTSVQTLADGITKLPPGEVNIHDNTDQVIKQLEGLGFAVSKIPGGNLKVTITYIDPLGLVTSGGIGHGVGLTARTPGGNAGGGVLPGFASGGLFRGGFASGGVGSSVTRQWRDFERFIPPEVLNSLTFPGAGGLFPSGLPIDTSLVSVSPPPDPNRMSMKDYLRSLLSNAGRGGMAGGGTPHGLLPGYSPGVDNMMVPLSGGEGIIIPEAMRALGGGWLYRLNSMFRSGLSRAGYRSGGVFPGDPASGDGLGPLPGPGQPSNDISVVGLLSQIRDLLAGKVSGSPLVDTAQAVSSIADGTAIPGTTGTAGTGQQLGPFGTPLKARNPAYDAMAGAISALGGDPEKFIGADPTTFFGTGGAGATTGAGGGQIAAALAAFAQSGNLAGVTGLGLDANDTVVKAIATARNKKKGGLDDPAIAGLVNQVLTGGGFTGTLDSSNTALIGSLQTFREKLAKGKVGLSPLAAGVPGAAVDPTLAGVATAPGLPGVDLATAGAPVPVWVTNFGGAAPGMPGASPVLGPDGKPLPGQPAAAGGTFPGSSILQAGFGAAGGVGSDLTGSLISAIASGTDFPVPAAPNADLEQLIRERNPNALASAFGLHVADFTRQGGGGGDAMSNDGPTFDSKGRMFSDTAALIDRTMTDLSAQFKASFDQQMDVLNQIKDRLAEEALAPILQSAVTSAFDTAGEKLGTAIGQAAGPIIAEAVKSAVAGIAASSGSGASAVGGGTADALTGIVGGLFDEGGIMPTNSIGVNLSGFPERVLSPAETRLFDAGMYGGWNLQPLQQHMATTSGVSGNATVGADFFGVSQIPIIGAIVNMLVSILLKLIGVDIQVRDTLDEMSDQVRQFRGDFQRFDATGRLTNDTSALLDRSSTSEQTAADERIRILKIVLEALVKFIIEKILVPIGKAVANAAISAGGAAAGGAINGVAPGAGGIVQSLISSAGSAGVDIGADLISSFFSAATPVLIDAVGEGLTSFFPDIMTSFFGGGLASMFLDPVGGIFGGLIDTLTGGFMSLFGGGLLGVFSGLLGGLSFDSGGVASGVGLMQKNVIAPERVLSPRQNVAFEQMVAREFGNRSSTGNRTVVFGDTHIAGTQASADDIAEALSRRLVNAL